MMIRDSCVAPNLVVNHLISVPVLVILCHGLTQNFMTSFRNNFFSSMFGTDVTC